MRTAEPKRKKKDSSLPATTPVNEQPWLLFTTALRLFFPSINTCSFPYPVVLGLGLAMLADAELQFSADLESAALQEKYVTSISFRSTGPRSKHNRDK